MFGLGSLTGIMSGVKGLVGAFKLDPSEKKEFEVKMQALLQQRDSEIEATIRQELQAKERVLVAELTQGSTYTKAARPTVVYYGLFRHLRQLHAYSLPAMGFREHAGSLRATYGVLASLGRDREHLVDWPERRAPGRTQ